MTLFLYDRMGRRIGPGTILRARSGLRYSVQWIEVETLLLHVRATCGPRRRMALTMDDLAHAQSGWRIEEPSDATEPPHGTGRRES